MLPELHKLMDEKVDIYAENANFEQYLNLYYSTNDEKYLTKCWPIMYRCACNILKKRFGKQMSWQDIAEHGINMCEILVCRIKNRNRWPDGYPVLNLPTVLGNCILNEFYSPSKLREKEQENNSVDYDELENYIGVEYTYDYIEGGVECLDS